MGVGFLVFGIGFLGVLGQLASAQMTKITLAAGGNGCNVVEGTMAEFNFEISSTTPPSPTAVLQPFVNGKQWGGDVYYGNWNGTGVEGWGGDFSGSFSLPVPQLGDVSVVLGLVPSIDGPTVGNKVPNGVPLSNAVSCKVSAANWGSWTPTRALDDGETHVGLDWEPWFTPHNFDWAGGVMWAEAIPVVGRYDSFDLTVLRQHALWFARSQVDVLAVDWTNNLWGKSSWGQRAENVQELVNATQLAVGVYAGMRQEGIPVPRFLMLLGLDNGPTTTLEAITEEIDFLASAVLGNASAGGAESFVTLNGKPVVVVFDGTGADHSSYTHPNFTVRWMASQLQNNPSAVQRGYWSWMDGVVDPTIAKHDSKPEASTSTCAYFADHGWLGPLAKGKRGGATLFEEVVSILSRASPLPILWVNQWNEFAGQPNGGGYGPNKDDYVDSYSSELTNDMEPTSLTACAYRRPNTTCGGWGFRQLNLLTLTSQLAHNASSLTSSSTLFLTTPTWGQRIPLHTPFQATLEAYTFTGDSRIATKVQLNASQVIWEIDGLTITPLATSGTTATLPPFSTQSTKQHLLTATAKTLSTNFPLPIDSITTFPSQPQPPVATAVFYSY